MQRVKVLGGRLTAGQWTALAELAEAFSPGTPLHLTTRQDVEFHDVAAAEVAGLQEGLAAARLATFGACGDTPRNITLSPCSGVLDGSVDLGPLAWQIHNMLEATEGITALPRKFKISLSASASADAQPWINDVGLVAVQDASGPWGFRAIVAGSLGAVPETGMLFADFLPADEALPLVAAAIELFAAEGDRTHRRKARLRHVRQRVGDEAFVRMLQAAVGRVKAARSFPAVDVPVVRTGLRAQLSLTFANGDVASSAALALGLLAARDDVVVRLGNPHRVILFGPGHATLLSAVADHEALAGALNGPAIVACPGTRWCSRALVDTNAAADAIRRSVAGRLPDGATVCVSGCPNGCAHSAVADVGLIGVRAGGEQRYNVMTGGGMGRTADLAAPQGRKLALPEVLAEIGRWIETDRKVGDDADGTEQTR